MRIAYRSGQSECKSPPESSLLLHNHEVALEPGAPGSPFFWANLGNGVGHYAFRRSRVVEIESEWTARDRDFQNVRWSQPDLSLPQVSVQRKGANLMG